MGHAMRTPWPHKAMPIMAMHISLRMACICAAPRSLPALSAACAPCMLPRKTKVSQKSFLMPMPLSTLAMTYLGHHA